MDNLSYRYKLANQNEVSRQYDAMNAYHAEIFDTLVTLAVINDSLRLRTADMSCNVSESTEEVGLGADDDNDTV